MTPPAPRPVSSPAPRPEAERQRTGSAGDTRSEREAIESTEPKKPGFLATARARMPFVDHLVLAAARYSEQRGAYFAAGITYYTVLALVPLVMVAFAGLGFVLVGQPGLVQDVQDRVTDAVPSSLREISSELIQVAIDQRSAVGLVGLAGAIFSGLGWMSNIREGLTAIWRQTPPARNFVVKKLADLGAFVSLGLALVVSLLISVVGGASTSFVIDLAGVDDVPGAFLLTRAAAIVLSILVSWVLFTWVIAKLPRTPVHLRSALSGALFAAVAFEGFKQAASYVLQGTLSSPGFELFGPIIALLVFVFYTGQVVLFSTAYAATTAESLRDTEVPVPGPAVISTRVQVSAAPSVRGVLGGAAVAVAAVLGVQRWRSR